MCSDDNQKKKNFLEIKFKNDSSQIRRKLPVNTSISRITISWAYVDFDTDDWTRKLQNHFRRTVWTNHQERRDVIQYRRINDERLEIHIGISRSSRDAIPQTSRTHNDFQKSSHWDSLGERMEFLSLWISKMRKMCLRTRCRTSLRTPSQLKCSLSSESVENHSWMHRDREFLPSRSMSESQVHPFVASNWRNSTSCRRKTKILSLLLVTYLYFISSVSFLYFLCRESKMYWIRFFSQRSDRDSHHYNYR